ncbi:hypothetical protein ABZ892_31815 [Streptomyces sp. NPDC046924]|uniref:hypothetical protein n=1 Tax=Streptomyces sp. NPDC046924 TaxID=3155136 RepID=UPI0034027691
MNTLFRGPHSWRGESGRATHTGSARAGAGIASTGILLISKAFLSAGGPGPGTGECRLREAVEALARHAEREGRKQEKLRGVWNPPPIQLRFMAVSGDLVAQRANILGVDLDETDCASLVNRSGFDRDSRL